jgi:hypothetical protein
MATSAVENTIVDAQVATVIYFTTIRKPVCGSDEVLERKISTVLFFGG